VTLGGSVEGGNINHNQGDHTTDIRSICIVLQNRNERTEAAVNKKITVANI